MSCSFPSHPSPLRPHRHSPDRPRRQLGWTSPATAWQWGRNAGGGCRATRARACFTQNDRIVYERSVACPGSACYPPSYLGGLLSREMPGAVLWTIKLAGSDPDLSCALTTRVALRGSPNTLRQLLRRDRLHGPSLHATPMSIQTDRDPVELIVLMELTVLRRTGRGPTGLASSNMPHSSAGIVIGIPVVPPDLVGVGDEVVAVLPRGVFHCRRPQNRARCGRNRIDHNSFPQLRTCCCRP